MVLELSSVQVENAKNPHFRASTAATTHSNFNDRQGILSPMTSIGTDVQGNTEFPGFIAKVF